MRCINSNGESANQTAAIFATSITEDRFEKKIISPERSAGSMISEVLTSIGIVVLVIQQRVCHAVRKRRRQRIGAAKE